MFYLSTGVNKTRASYLPSFIALSISAIRVLLLFVAYVREFDNQALMTFGIAFGTAADIILLCTPGYIGCLLAAITFGVGLGTRDSLYN